MQAAGADIVMHQFFQPRLVDRDDALLQPLDLVGDLVDAGDVPADIGQAGAAYQTDIAGSYDSEFHRNTLSIGGIWVGVIA